LNLQKVGWPVSVLLLSVWYEPTDDVSRHFTTLPSHGHAGIEQTTAAATPRAPIIQARVIRAENVEFRPKFRRRMRALDLRRAVT